MPSVFTDEMAVHDFTILDSTDWTTETAALPNADNAQSPTSGAIDDTYFLVDTSELDFRSGSWSVEFWVYLEAGLSNAVNMIVICGNDSESTGVRWQLYLDASEKVVFGLSNASGNPVSQRTSTSALSTATWYYVVCQIASGAVPDIYLNTTLDNGSSVAAGTPNAPGASHRVWLGTDNLGGSDLPSTVRVAKLAIYNRALTSGERTAHYLAMTT